MPELRIAVPTVQYRCYSPVRPERSSLRVMLFGVVLEIGPRPRTDPTKVHVYTKSRLTARSSLTGRRHCKSRTAEKVARTVPRVQYLLLYIQCTVSLHNYDVKNSTRPATTTPGDAGSVGPGSGPPRRSTGPYRGPVFNDCLPLARMAIDASWLHLQSALQLAKHRNQLAL